MPGVLVCVGWESGFNDLLFSFVAPALPNVVSSLVCKAPTHCPIVEFQTHASRCRLCRPVMVFVTPAGCGSGGIAQTESSMRTAAAKLTEE